MTGNNVKVEKFIFDYFEYINDNSNMKKHSHIFDILMNSSYNSKHNILDKEMITLYFTDEQLVEIKAKQKELGYENNLSRFARYALFNFFINEHNIVLHNDFLIKPIDYDKFNLLINKCKDELINGEYTSYNLDLLRNNKKYEDKISFFNFNNTTKKMDFNIDFLEYDMLAFIQCNFEKGKLYSELVGLSTEQYTSDDFIETKNNDYLESFIDYSNIVPNTDSFYYLFLYYAFVIDPGRFDINEIFDETDEHIDLLLKKYSFSKIVKYFKEKYNMTNTYDIFDKKCVETLLSDNVIISDNITEVKDVIKSSDVIKSDEITESNTIVKLNENIDIK